MDISLLSRGNPIERDIKSFDRAENIVVLFAINQLSPISQRSCSRNYINIYMQQRARDITQQRRFIALKEKVVRRLTRSEDREVAREGRAEKRKWKREGEMKRVEGWQGV